MSGLRLPVDGPSCQDLAHNRPFSPFFAEVVCTVGAAPHHVAASPPPIGGELHYMRLRHAGDTPLEGFM